MGNHRCNADLIESHEYDWEGLHYICTHHICTICKAGKATLTIGETTTDE